MAYRLPSSLAAVAFASLVACGHHTNATPGGGVDAGGGGTDSGNPTTDAGGDDASGGVDAGGAVTCTHPSTAYVMNGGTCGTYRWAVKTGTDNDVSKVSMIPKPATVATLVTIPTPSVATCTRATSAEQQVYELKNIDVKFEREEADDDYHLVGSDQGGSSTMVMEVPFPGCIGHDSCQGTMPWTCEISRARATVDAKVAQGTMVADLGTATVIGVGFWDVYELNGTTHPTGMAPNGIEIHPILAFCVGQGCALPDRLDR